MIEKMDGLTNAILLGISSGTFIYLAASEIIMEEFSITMHKYAKFFSLSLGVALIVGVYFIEKYIFVATIRIRANLCDSYLRQVIWS
jgi:hypothetical protein